MADTTLEAKTLELAAVGAEALALRESGLHLPMAAAMPAVRAAVLRNQIHDIGLGLTVMSGPWLSWLRVPVAEVARLQLDDAFSDSSYRSDEHYYLDASDTEVYRSRRRVEGCGDLQVAGIVSFHVPGAPGVERLDDYRARGWTPRS